MFLVYKVRKLVNIGTEESPYWKVGYFPKKLLYCGKDAVERAKRESYNGKYDVVYSGRCK